MIPIQWTSKLQNHPKKKEEFEALLRNNLIILETLFQIVTEREESLMNILFSLSPSKDVDKDNLIGRIAELRELKKLLNIT